MNIALSHKIIHAVKHSGTNNPVETLFRIEESLTQSEYDTANSFLTWCHKNDRIFGHGNILDVFKEFAGVSEISSD